MTYYFINDGNTSYVCDEDEIMQLATDHHPDEECPADIDTAIFYLTEFFGCIIYELDMTKNDFKIMVVCKDFKC